MSTIVDEQGLLEALPVLRRRQIRRLRRLGIIPHIRLGSRGVLYDTATVVEALKGLEVKTKTKANTAK